MKKTLSVLLSLLMLMSITAGLDFSAYSYDNTIKYYENNPLYDQSELSFAENGFAKNESSQTFSDSSSTQSEVLYSVTQAADFLREHMVDRE